MLERLIGPPADEPARDPHKCFVYDCPLPGVFTPEIRGSEKWFCIVHDMLNSDEWHAATVAVNERAAMFRFCRKLLTAEPNEPVSEAIRLRFTKAGRDDLAAIEANTCRQYGGSVRQKLINECRGIGGGSAREQRPALPGPKPIAGYL